MTVRIAAVKKRCFRSSTPPSAGKSWRRARLIPNDFVHVLTESAQWKDCVSKKVQKNENEMSLLSYVLL